MNLLFLSSSISLCNADLKEDRQKCADKLVGLAGCIPYVGGDAKSPTTECCSGLKLVLQNSRECLCLLIKDRNDPNLGLKINATSALSLPQKCHAPANVSACPALLHLAPNSPDAKVFDDFAKSGGESSNTSSPAEGQESSSAAGKGSSAATIPSDGGKGMRLEMILALGMLFILLLHVFTNF